MEDKDFDGGGGGGGSSKSPTGSVATSLSNGRGNVESHGTGVTSVAQLLLTKDKCHAAKYLHDQCIKQMRNLPKSPTNNSNNTDSKDASPSISYTERYKVLSDVMDILLGSSLPPSSLGGHPLKKQDVIDWIKWLMAGGKTPDEFFNTGKFSFFSSCVVQSPKNICNRRRILIGNN